MSTPEVMLIVVGNMLDKGEVLSSPLITIILSRQPLTCDTYARTPRPFRNTLDKCPHQKAQR